MESIPALVLWELIIDVFHPLDTPLDRGDKTPRNAKNIYEELASVDYVPTNLLAPNGKAVLVLLEDNDFVIHICIKGKIQHCVMCRECTE